MWLQARIKKYSFVESTLFTFYKDIASLLLLVCWFKSEFVIIDAFNYAVFIMRIFFQVVVIFVICVVFLLVTYMLFLMCLDPMLRKQRHSVPYRQQSDEVFGCFHDNLSRKWLIKLIIDNFFFAGNNLWLQMEDNIFARTTPTNQRFSDISPSVTMRSRNSKFLAKFDEFFISSCTFCCFSGID